MKRFIFLCVSFILLVALIFPRPFFLRGKHGLYHPGTGLFWATNEHSYYHEVGHYIDGHNGKPSQSRDFLLAVIVYVYYMDHETDNRLPVEILARLGAPITEVYAEIYAITRGNVPDIFKPFYPPIMGEFRTLDIFGGTLYYGLHNPGH